MKKILFILLVSFCATIFNTNAQVLKTNPALGEQHPRAENLLLISKEQKKTAWTLLGIGGGVAAIGGIVQLNAQQKDSWGFDFTGAWMAIAGGVVALSCVPFFISSAKNAQKAATMAFNMQQIFLPNPNNLVTKYQPAFTLKFRLPHNKSN